MPAQLKTSASHSGFTYIGLMLIIAIAGIALSGVGIVWHTEMQRENERELQYIGKQYAQAIGSYYECKLCGPAQYPKTLQELLKDNRVPAVMHHIRKLYRDPMTRSDDWGLVKQGGRIVGIYSKSKLQPLAKAAILNILPIDINASKSVAQAKPVAQVSTDAKKTVKKTKITYQDWRFVYEPGGATIVTPAKPASVNPTTTANANVDNPSSNIAPVVEPEPESEPEEVPEEDPTKACDLPYEADSQSCSKQCQSGASPAVCNACFKDVKKTYDECRSSLKGR